MAFLVRLRRAGVPASAVWVCKRWVLSRRQAMFSPSHAFVERQEGAEILIFQRTTWAAARTGLLWSPGACRDPREKVSKASAGVLIASRPPPPRTAGPEDCSLSIPSVRSCAGRRVWALGQKGLPTIWPTQGRRERTRFCGGTAACRAWEPASPASDPAASLSLACLCQLVAKFGAQSWFPVAKVVSPYQVLFTEIIKTKINGNVPEAAWYFLWVPGGFYGSWLNVWFSICSISVFITKPSCL